MVNSTVSPPIGFPLASVKKAVMKMSRVPLSHPEGRSPGNNESAGWVPVVSGSVPITRLSVVGCVKKVKL